MNPVSSLADHEVRADDLMRVFRNMDDRLFVKTIRHMEGVRDPVLNLISFDHFVNRELALRAVVKGGAIAILKDDSEKLPEPKGYGG